MTIFMNMNNITPEKFQTIYDQGYNIDMLYFIFLTKNGACGFINTKLIALEQTCIRKGLLSEDLKITAKGQELLAYIDSKDEAPKLAKKKPKKLIEVDNAFIQWWKIYPSSDTFEYKNKKFAGTRALKVKKDECKVKLNKILLEAEFTLEEMIEALKLEIHQKVENSLKTGINKMSYFQNSLTYLNQGTYEAYVELVRKGHKAADDKKQTSYGGVSI